MEIHPDDVPELPHEVRVATQLERLDAVGLQAVRPPNAMHDGMTEALGLGHGSHRPVRRIRRGGVQRGVDHGLDFLGRHGGSAARPGRVLQQSDNPGLAEPVAPEIHGRPADAELAGDRVDRASFASRQDDHRPRRHPLRSLAAAHQGVQIGALRGTERHCRGRFPHADKTNCSLGYCTDIYVTLH